jgi:hypothetical protein
MDTTTINDKIKVGAVFDDAAVIRPKWFVWNTKRYDIKQITYSWRTTTGDAVILHFSVSDGSTLFEISYNQKSLKWQLEKTSTE